MNDDAASPPPPDGTSRPNDLPGRSDTDGSGDAGTVDQGRLRSIFERDDRSRSEKITAALHLGLDRFDVTNAYLAHVDPAEGLHTITETIGEHPKLAVGTDTALAQTYCREAIARQAPLLLTDAPAEGWAEDPAYQRYGFSTYLSAKVRVGDALYGTVCFVDEASRDDVTAADTDFLEHLADEIGRELNAPDVSPSTIAPKDLLARIQEVAEVGAWVYDAETDAVTGTDGLYRLLELPEGKEFDLETGFSFYPPDVRADIEAAVRECLEEGTPFDLNTPLVTAKGTRRWVRVRGRSQQRDDGGVQMTGTVQDITRQKQIEETLEEERSVLRRMYRITADREASFADKIERLIEVGREYLDLPYGFLTRIEENTQHIVHAQGTHPLLQPGSSCPLTESYCRKTIQQESLLAVRDVFSAGWGDDPAVKTFELGAYIGAKVLVENELYGTFCFAAHEARDVSFSGPERTFVELLSRWASYELEQQTATERLEHQNERLDRLAAVVSHDLRNPLNVAQGRLQLAEELIPTEEGDRASEIGDHLDAIGRAHTRIETIIEDMLALTQSGEPLTDDDLESLSFREVVEASWSQVDTERATLQVEQDGVLQASEGRLRQLLENLFRNAVEHGGPSVTVRVGRGPDGFYVEDDGDGLPGEDPEKLFASTYTTSEEGTGLGLSIARTVAEAHGWTITATDGAHGGARFEIMDVD